MSPSPSPSRSRNRRSWTFGLVLVAGASVGLGVACLIPDRDIQVISTDINEHAVRFVEGIPLTPEVGCACSTNACTCPQPPATPLPKFLDPSDTGYQFCICGENEIDSGRLAGITFYVEDQDEEDGEPTDPILIAALLDWDPTLNEPATDYVAYTSYVDSRRTLDLEISDYESAIKRPRPYTRSITLQLDGSFDPCNGAGRPLEPGFHTLTLMATDRDWFTRDLDTGSMEPTGDPVTLVGVPDIANGATYDMQTYVFHCFSKEDETECGCVDIGD